MRQTLSLFLLSAATIMASGLSAQERTKITEADKTALEGIIVEKYYTATPADALDTTGGYLAAGSVTYRIYVDMKPGYQLQAVFGLPKHELFLKTSTTFFNNRLGGISGDQIFDSKLNNNTIAFDSWLTINAASKSRYGVLLKDDKDSSIIKRSAFSKADGLMMAGDVQKLLYYGIDLAPFGNEAKNTSVFQSGNGSWVSIGHGKGPTEDNRVLIAQLTTAGKLSFELNLQMGTPTGGTIQFVARNPSGDEVKSKHLVYRQK